MQNSSLKYKILRKTKRCQKAIKFFACIFIMLSMIISPFNLRLERNKAGEISIKPTMKATPAIANNQFTPTAGVIREGSAATITAATAASSNGTNVGSWKGTLADDNYHWVINSTSSGYDANLTVGGVALNGANMMMIETEIDLDATIPPTYFQI